MASLAPPPPRLAPLRPRGRFALAGAATAGVLLALALALRVIEPPDVAGALSDGADSLGAWTYLAVPALAFLETGAFVGLVVPGETAIVVGGVVAERGEVSLPVLIGLVWVAAVGGDTVSFLLGRRYGRPFLDAHGARLRIRQEQIERVERLFDRHGGKAIVVGRFVGILRALTPFVAGASRFPLRRFLPYTAVGALGWAATFTLVGYGFSESFESAGRDASRIALTVALVVGAAVLVVGVRLSRTRRVAPPHTEKRESAGGLLLVVNERASGVEDPRRTADELVALLQELGATAEGVVTHTQDDLFEALRSAAATDRRVVVVGGDGSLHEVANAPLGRLPELALVPAGRANNIARALGIPTDRAGALAVAAGAPVRPLDALRVETPERRVYALEALSAGFQAEARSTYNGKNSADLPRGLRAAAGAIWRFAPYRVRARVDGGELNSSSGAQLFFSNLPYFGFGFEVDPGADPADGRLEAILIEAQRRRTLLRLLAAAYRGRHLGRRGVERISSRHAELTEPLPLVADATPLGTTTATVDVEPARLRVAVPGRGASA